MRSGFFCSSINILEVEFFMDLGHSGVLKENCLDRESIVANIRGDKEIGRERGDHTST